MSCTVYTNDLVLCRKYILVTGWLWLCATVSPLLLDLAAGSSRYCSCSIPALYKCCKDEL